MTNFDTQAVTEEGYVLKDPAGNYIAFSERRTHTGDHCEVRPVRLAEAAIFSSPQGPRVQAPGSRKAAALRDYQNTIPDGTLEAIRVVRTTHTTISERPKDAPSAA